jgi:hypothetical protein
MDRHPDIIKKVNEEYLSKPGAVKTFLDTQCRQFSLRKATDVKTVSDYFGVAPTPTRAGTNETALCSDYNGAFAQFYKYAAQCFFHGMRTVLILVDFHGKSNVDC